MIEARTNRRGLVLLVGVALIAGCKVIPKAPSGGPPPEPGPTDALPKDQARHRVALLLPLSGPDAALGNSIANATTMAVLDTNAQTLRITTYDTAGGVTDAARKAMQEGNKLILGPLLSGDVSAVASVARGAKVPLITYGNDPSVAARDVFVMGTTQDNSILRVVEFAKSKGITRFALLAPKGDAGNRAAAAYRAAVTVVGGTLIASDSYDRGTNSVLSAAARLRAKGGYQAVLIADAPRAAGQAAARLRVGAGNPRILGTDLWSGDPLASSTASLRGAWFAAVSDTRFRQFVTSYQTRFGAAPFRQATMGYDSVLLTVRIARDWRAGTAFPYARLVDTGGFLGLDGPFRFNASGLNERALEVRETRAGGVTILSPAPDKFVD
jgi:ABC-type branched-subunit amino acid transport system substrate-binding protein